MFLEGQLNWLEASEKARGNIGLWKARICLGWQISKRGSSASQREEEIFLGV